MDGAGGQDAGRAFLRHPSIRALLEAEGTAGGPDEAIRRRARALVDRALRLGWEGPPFDLDLLASVAGYRVVYTDLLGADQDGCIDAVARCILVSARLSLSRQRFTVAHELAHTLFPDFGTVRRHAVPAEPEWAEQSPVEQICQVGAAELLMPLAPFQAATANASVSIDGIATLAHLFGASFKAAARRRVALAPRGVALVVARPVGPGGALAVVASVQAGSGKPVYLPWSRLLPAGSVAHQVWECGRAPGPRPCRAAAGEDWGRLGRLGRRWVEAVALPLSWERPNAVLCLLHPVHDPPATP